MIKIKTGKHLNMNAIIIYTESLQVKILPEIGFKMASIVYKPKNKEFLFQPTKRRYEIPKYGDDFEKYDTSGLDEMVPTVDKSQYPAGDLKGKMLPDHGDVWSLPWNTDVCNNKITGKVKLRSLPLEFIKSVSFSDEHTIRMDYKVKNLSDKDIYYIWTLHGLNVFDENTEFIFQEDMNSPINVHSNEELDKLNLKYLKNYKDKS